MSSTAYRQSMTLCHGTTCKNYAEIGHQFCSSCSDTDRRVIQSTSRPGPPISTDSGSVNMQMQYLRDCVTYWKGEAEFWRREAERLSTRLGRM